MSENLRELSADEIDTLAAYLPTDLTYDQAEKVIRACRAACGIAWRNGSAAQRARRNLYIEIVPKFSGASRDETPDE